MDIFTVTSLLNEKRISIITMIIIRVLKKPRLSKCRLKSESAVYAESAKSTESVESTESAESNESAKPVTSTESVSASVESTV